MSQRIAAPVRQAGRSIIDGSMTSRPIVAGLSRVSNALGNAARVEARDNELDAEAALRLEQQQLERERAAAIADRAGARAELLASLDVFVGEARQTAAPGAAGHGERIKQEVEQKLTEFRTTLGNDPEVRERFEPMLRGDAARIVGEERAFELVQFGQYQGDQWKMARDRAAVELQKKPTVETFNRVMQEGEILLAGMKLPGNVTLRLAQEDSSVMGMTLLETQLAAGNSDAVRAVLNSKAPFPIEADDRARLLQRADLVDERKAREAEMAASEQRDAARTAVKTVEAIIDSGAVPTKEQMTAVRAAIGALPPDERIEYTAIEIQVGVAQEVQGMAPAQIRARRNFLAERVQSGRASQSEQMQLAAFDRQLDGAEDRAASDVKAALGEGVEGRFALVNQAQQQSREDRFAVLEKVEPGLGYVAMLPRPQIRRKALEGGVMRKERKQLVDSKRAERAFAGTVGQALAGQYEGYGAVMNIAMDMYAVDAARLGKEEFDSNLFDQNVQLALGGVRRDGEWYGGVGEVNGAKVLLPDGVSAPMLRSSIARIDWTGARTGDNRPVSKAFIVGQMRPVIADEDEKYVWYDMVDKAGGVLLGPNGNPFRAKVAKK
jgi:hypothetical protein